MYDMGKYGEWADESDQDASSITNPELSASMKRFADALREADRIIMEENDEKLENYIQ